MRELELKFAVHASFFVDSSTLEGAGVARGEQLSLLDLRATYYDSPDLRLARNGVTLRYRRGDEEGDGWHLKLPVGDHDATLRDELHFEGPPGKVPDAVRELVTAYVRSAPMGPVATLRTRRNRWSLIDAGDRELAVLYDDEVSVLESRRVVARFRELELEASAADRQALERIAEDLRKAGALGAEAIPKVVRALGPQATSAPDVGPGRQVAPSEAAAVAIKEATASSVHRLLTNDARARLGEVEGVHQMRVATRRLRSDLRTYGHLVDAPWAADLREELRWLGGVLGDVRDHDVLLHRLHVHASDLEDELKPLWRILEARHDAARQQLLSALRGDRYRSLLDRLVEAARTPALTTAAAATSEETLPSLVAATWKKLANEARAAGPDTPDDDLHGIRIRAKRTRYAAEAVAPALGSRGEEATKFAKLVTRVQDVLGEHQDAIIAGETIKDIAAEVSEDAAFSLAAGQLVERERRAALDARAMFPEVWRKLDRKKHRSWMQA